MACVLVLLKHMARTLRGDGDVDSGCGDASPYLWLGGDDDADADDDTDGALFFDSGVGDAVTISMVQVYYAGDGDDNGDAHSDYFSWRCS